MESLERDLKARRAKVRAKADQKKNERLGLLEEKLKANISEELTEQNQIKKQLEIDEGKGQEIENQIDQIALKV